MEGGAVKASAGRAGAPVLFQAAPALYPLGQLSSTGPAGEDGSHINHQRQSREKAHFSLLPAGQLPTANEKQKLSLDKPFTGARVLAARPTVHWARGPGSAAPPAEYLAEAPKKNPAPPKGWPHVRGRESQRQERKKRRTSGSGETEEVVHRKTLRSKDPRARLHTHQL